MGPFTIKCLCFREQVSIKKVVPGSGQVIFAHLPCIPILTLRWVSSCAFLLSILAHFLFPFYLDHLFKNNTYSFYSAEEPSEKTKKLVIFWPK